MTARTPQEQAFLAGRDVAAELLQAAAKAASADDAYIEARYRDGRPQRNFALPFLQELVAKPSLLRGFAAVLSDCLATGQTGSVPGADVFSGLLLGEMLGPTNDMPFQRFLVSCLK
jgi:hypothetical protein